MKVLLFLAGLTLLVLAVFSLIKRRRKKVEPVATTPAPTNSSVTNLSPTDEILKPKLVEVFVRTETENPPTQASSPIKRRRVVASSRPKTTKPRSSSSRKKGD